MHHIFQSFKFYCIFQVKFAAFCPPQFSQMSDGSQPQGNILSERAHIRPLGTACPKLRTVP